MGISIRKIKDLDVRALYSVFYCSFGGGSSKSKHMCIVEADEIVIILQGILETGQAGREKVMVGVVHGRGRHV